MKTKENEKNIIFNFDRPLKTEQAKPKSLRPMRSMLAVRSLKPKTIITAFKGKEEVVNKD